VQSNNHSILLSALLDACNKQIKAAKAKKTKASKEKKRTSESGEAVVEADKPARCAWGCVSSCHFAATG
jgi:hypothetical protein